MPLEPTNSLIVELNRLIEPMVSPEVRAAIMALYAQLRADYAFLEDEHDQFVASYQETLMRLDRLEEQVAKLQRGLV
jgi:hypothetical protein